MLNIFMALVICLLSCGCGEQPEQVPDVTEFEDNGATVVESNVTPSRLVIWPDFYNGMAVASDSSFLLFRENGEGEIQVTGFGNNLSLSRALWVAPRELCPCSLGMETQAGKFYLSDFQPEVEIVRSVVEVGKDWRRLAEGSKSSAQLSVAGATFRIEMLAHYPEGYIWPELWRAPAQPQSSFSTSGLNIKHESWDDAVPLNHIITASLDGYDSVKVKHILGTIEYLDMLYIFFRYENGVAVFEAEDPQIISQFGEVKE